MVGIPGKGRIEGAKIDSTPEIYLYFHVTADAYLESRDQNKTNISNLCNCGVAITCKSGYCLKLQSQAHFKT